MLLALAFLIVASRLAICGKDADGQSSLSDGLQCRPNSEWDLDNWRIANGTNACLGTRNSYGVQDYDLSIPACADAIKKYSALMDNNFTCNCTGEFSYLQPSGLRPGLLLIIAEAVTYIIMAFLMPVLGAYADHTKHRKKNVDRWQVLYGYLRHWYGLSRYEKMGVDYRIVLIALSWRLL